MALADFFQRVTKKRAKLWIVFALFFAPSILVTEVFAAPAPLPVAAPASEAQQHTQTIAQLLEATAAALRKSPQESNQLLSVLERQKDKFTKQEETKFYLLKSSSLGLQGRNLDRITLVNSYLNKVTDPDIRSMFLYQLSTAYTELNQYENALKVMNEGISLLAKLSDVNAKISTLQSAVSMLISLHAYDEAYAYTERMLELKGVNDDLSVQCYGLANQVEIHFLRGEHALAKQKITPALNVCDSNGRSFISYIIKSLYAIDLVGQGEYEKGVTSIIPLLGNDTNATKVSETTVQLQEALGRGYLHLGKLAEAEKVTAQALQNATNAKYDKALEMSNETMSKIKQAQGQFSTALEFANAAMGLKDKLLDDQLQKNIAYQRAQFDMQDKANQLTLLEQKNKLLSFERQLEKKNNEVLLLLVGLAAILLLASGVWLWRVIQQKNLFKRHAQTDGLTQISNRSHFMTVSTTTVAERTAPVSMILFDMDFFKRINDNFGHPTGDWVLRNVCLAVKEVLRAGDTFGRLGGEEFAICMPSADTQVAVQLAERCRLAIAAIDTEPSGFRFPLTASFGIATIDTNGIASFEALMECADKALYKSKSEGRNCVSVFE